MRTPSWRGCRRAARLARELTLFSAVFNCSERAAFAEIAKSFDAAHERLAALKRAHPQQSDRQLFTRVSPHAEALLSEARARLRPGESYSPARLKQLWNRGRVLTEAITKLLCLRGDLARVGRSYTLIDKGDT